MYENTHIHHQLVVSCNDRAKSEHELVDKMMEKTTRTYCFILNDKIFQLDNTLRMSSSTTVNGIPRILIRYSPSRIGADDERRLGLRLRVRREYLSREPIPTINKFNVIS